MVHGPQDPSLKSVQAPGSTTRMLVAQVAERTSELRAANEHLEAVNAKTRGTQLLWDRRILLYGGSQNMRIGPLYQVEVIVHSRP